MKNAIVGFVFVASGLCAGCNRGGPSDAELEAKLAAMMAKQGGAASATPGAPAPSAKAAAKEDYSDEVLYESTCLPAEATKQSKTTMKLLTELEKLMADYAPKLPPSPDAPTKCMTKVSEANDPQGAKVEKLLERDYKKRADQAKREREGILRRFAEVDLPLAWTWVSAIAPGHEFEVLRMRVDRCPGNNFDGECDEGGRCGAGTDQSDCGGSTPLLVTEPTELMIRLGSRPDLKVDAPHFCVVQEAELKDGRASLTCRGPARSDAARFFVEVEGAAGKSGGTLAAVGVGDLVEFSGHLVLTHKPHASREQPTWHFLKVLADGVKIVAESVCCHGEAK